MFRNFLQISRNHAKVLPNNKLICSFIFLIRYQELPNFNQTELNTLFHQTVINADQKADIIAFYNTVYLPQMKPYLNSLNSNRSGEVDSKSYTPLLKPPVIPMLALASPLRESLPQCNSALSRKSPMVRPGMTPNGSSNHIYAFGESPRRALDKINGALFASKRIINFEEGAPESSHKEKKYVNPMLERIMDQRNDESEDSQKKGTYYLIYLSAKA